MVNDEKLYINNITKTYKNGCVLANSDISTILLPNQITALIGHNGAGKTTLLNQICGNTHPDKGNIIYKGISLINKSNYARQMVSTMPQFHVPLSGVTLHQSIESILYIRGLGGRIVNKKTNEIIEDLDIKKWEKYSGDKLSGGLQRLTSFAMAVTSQAPIILLDEPTNDVDPIRRKLIWSYMRKLAANGRIIVVVTHNLLEVEQFADRYIMMDKGRIIKDVCVNGVNASSIYSTLSIELLERIKLDNYPNAVKVKYNENNIIIFKLEMEQISDAIKWVLDLIALGKIVRYKLETETLDTVYEEEIER